MLRACGAPIAADVFVIRTNQEWAYITRKSIRTAEYCVWNIYDLNKLHGKDRSETMHYIRITKENIDKEHICCAMSGKQSIVKKEWLKQRFENELVEEKRIW